MRLLRYPVLGSTMDEARSAVAKERNFPFIILAEHQRAGRGRIEGRTWLSSPGASLTMTLCLDPALAQLPALPLRIGLGIAQYLKTLPGLAGRIALKWPNDILGWSEKTQAWKKLGGMICESSSSGLFAGIGINLKNEVIAPDIQAKAISLEEVLDRRNGCTTAIPELESLARGLSTSIISTIADPSWKEEYQKLLLGMGLETEFVQGDPRSGTTRSGTILGVDEEGFLLLSEAGSEVARYSSGEIARLGFREL